MTEPFHADLHFPDAEKAFLCDAYDAARVVLEYGSGGSTAYAASLPGKLVFSVESDPVWTANLRAQIKTAKSPSPVHLYHVDIGPVGQWGRPIDETHWTKFHAYPMAIWDQDFFQHPDVVLIDGRFRAACMMTTLARITKPVTILFDDYRDRKPYHVVEDYLKPREIVGGMAVFDAVPNLVGLDDLSRINGALAQAVYDGSPSFYDQPAVVAIARRRASLSDRLAKAERVAAEERKARFDETTILTRLHNDIISRNAALKRKHDALVKGHKEISDSLSWRVTAPLRKLHGAGSTGTGKIRRGLGRIYCGARHRLGGRR